MKNIVINRIFIRSNDIICKIFNQPAKGGNQRNTLLIIKKDKKVNTVKEVFRGE